MMKLEKGWSTDNLFQLLVGLGQLHLLQPSLAGSMSHFSARTGRSCEGSHPPLRGNLLVNPDLDPTDLAGPQHSHPPSQVQEGREWRIRRSVPSLPDNVATMQPGEGVLYSAAATALNVQYGLQIFEKRHHSRAAFRFAVDLLAKKIIEITVDDLVRDFTARISTFRVLFH